MSIIQLAVELDCSVEFLVMQLGMSIKTIESEKGQVRVAALSEALMELRRLVPWARPSTLLGILQNGDVKVDYGLEDIYSLPFIDYICANADNDDDNRPDWYAVAYAAVKDYVEYLESK